jgi:polyhydroxyalkanoate synthesis regulator phasin
MSEKEHPANWSELFTKTVELGVGAFHLTKETGQQLIGELEERSQMTRQQATDFINRMREVGQEHQHSIEEKINSAIDHALERADVARRSELADLRERIAALEANIAHVPAADTASVASNDVEVPAE